MVAGSQLERECSLQGNSLTLHRRFPARPSRDHRGPLLPGPGSVSFHPEAKLSVADMSVHPATSPLSLAACLLVPTPLLYVSPHLHHSLWSSPSLEPVNWSCTRLPLSCPYHPVAP